MYKCEHMWIVSSWSLSDHSQTAKELLCQKCGCIANQDILAACRTKGLVKVIQEPVRVSTELEALLAKAKTERLTEAEDMLLQKLLGATTSTD